MRPLVIRSPTRASLVDVHRRGDGPLRLSVVHMQARVVEVMEDGRGRALANFRCDKLGEVTGYNIAGRGAFHA